MARRRHEYDEEESLDFETSETPTDDESLDYEDEVLQGEKPDSLNSIDRIFNTEDSILYTVRKTLLGWELIEGKWQPTGKAIARTEVVNKIMNVMRRFVNSTNFISMKDEKEINYNMSELNKEVIFMLYDDPTVEDEDVEYAINQVDHTVNMFMGIIRDGEGSDSAKQIFSGTYQRRENNENKYKPLFSLESDDHHFLSFGGKKK